MAQKVCSLLTSPEKSQLLLTCGYYTSDSLTRIGKNIAAILKKSSDSYLQSVPPPNSASVDTSGRNRGYGSGTCGETPTNTAKYVVAEIPLSWWKT
jgi:hypothetical protein